MSAAAGYSQTKQGTVPPALLWTLLYYVAFLRALPVITLAGVIFIGARAVRARQR
jgi:hypothetical protein